MRHEIACLLINLAHRYDPCEGTVTKQEHDGLITYVADIDGQHYVLGNQPAPGQSLADTWQDHDGA